MRRLRAAILGSGHVGMDLADKALRDARHLDLVLVADIDAASAGLAHARELAKRETEGVA